MGDEVWVVNPNKEKLNPGKLGPAFVILVDKESNSYVVRDASGQERRCHLDLLRPCKVRARQRTTGNPVDAELLEEFGTCSSDQFTLDIRPSDW